MSSARPLKKLSALIMIGGELRFKLNRLLQRFSLLPDEPVLDPAQFAWTRLLTENWQAIRAEALAVTRNIEEVPILGEISPHHGRIAPDDSWRTFFLIGYGNRFPENLARCPVTASVLKKIPGLNSGFFSVLTAGNHIPAHSGVTKGLLTCHLGLKVPEGEISMRVDKQMLHWEEGKVLMFDDTFEHEVWNNTRGTRIVLLIQIARPLRLPGRLLAMLFLGGVRYSSFVREARRNIRKWPERSGEEKAI